MVLSALCFSVFAEAAAAKATLSGLKGAVTVQAAAGGEWTAATEGMSLSQGASVKTGASAEAILNMGAGGAVKISALALVKIDALTAEASGGSKTELSLDKGRVLARTEKLKTADSAFTVRTPTAVAGVRGTAFECAIAPETNQVTVSVVEGNVSVSVGDVEVLVAAGFASMVMPGEMPQEPAAIPPEQMEELKSEAGALEEAAGAEEKPEDEEAVEEAEESSEETTDTVTSDVVNKVTIQDSITDTVEKLTECIGGGGCINGTIEY